MKKSANYKKGFSLAEILIVLAIVAVLIAIAIPVLANAVEEAQAAACLANRAGAQRECIYAILNECPDGTYAEKAEVVNRVLSEYSGDELCPLHGSYSAFIHATLPEANKQAPDPYHEGEMIKADKVFSARMVTVTVFCSEHLDGRVTWTKGTQYTRGDIMESNGFIFQCLATHKSGSRSNTRDPSVKSNKGSWEVIGYSNGATANAYSATVRYSKGVLVTYNGNIYTRTDYNLTGGQKPYSNKNSRYWTLLGPAPEYITDQLEALKKPEETPP